MSALETAAKEVQSTFRDFPMPPAERLLGTFVSPGEFGILASAFFSRHRGPAPFAAVRDAAMLMHALSPEALLHFAPMMAEMCASHGPEAAGIADGLWIAFGPDQSKPLDNLMGPGARAAMDRFLAAWKNAERQWWA